MPAPTTYQPHAGRVALVTGAARAFGQAIAVGPAQRGARVVVGDLSACPKPASTRGLRCV